MTLVKALSRSSTTDAEREIVWKIVQDNFSVLKSSMGTSGMLNKLLKVVLAGFSSTIYISKVKEFFERCPYPEANQVLSEAMESIKVNAAWAKREKATLLSLQKIFNLSGYPN